MRLVQPSSSLGTNTSQFAPFIVSGLFSVLFASCGGGGGSGSPSPPPVVNQSAGGIWKGELTTTAGISVEGLALVTGKSQFYSEAKHLNNGCADVATGTLITSGNKVTLTYDSLYSQPSSLSKIAGTWVGTTGDVLNISSSGAIAEQAALPKPIRFCTSPGNPIARAVAKTRLYKQSR